jgi:putative membrane protein
MVMAGLAKAGKPALSEADHLRVSEAVHAAEAGTSGEIVTIIADHSDRYLDVALWWAAVATMVALAIVSAFPAFYGHLIGLFSNGWVTEVDFADGLRFALAVAVVTFAAVRLALQWVPLRVALTPGIVKAGRVRRRAIRYFKAGAERRTVGRTGILIYLSLSERRAEIVADEAIHALVSDDKWGEAMVDMIAPVREGRVADGMIAAIRNVGAILSAQFPRADDDRNELPDRLIEL